MSAEYELLTPPRWRPAGERVELWDTTRDRWVSLRAWTSHVLDGVARGESIGDIAARVEPREGRRRAHKAQAQVRQLLFGLAELRYVRLPGPEPPPLHDARYRTVRELGRGGVGVAWLCRDEADDGREVVVKRAWDFLQPYSVTEEAMRREADVMARLDHDGIARLHRTFESDGHLHLVREFVRGDLLERAAPLPTPAARLDAAAQVADVLAAVHDAGYLLLDLRPANFLLHEGRVRLLDVGQCRALESGRLVLARPIGSPGYRSPEMRASASADARSDVWGLGRLLAFLATGAAPPEDLPGDALGKRLSGPEGDLVARLSAEVPEERPATMRDALALLRAAAANAAP